MSRRFTVAALALALAGGVYLSGGPAEASNMGFKLERDFHAVGPPATPAPFQGIYFFSAPLFNGLADIANTLDANGNPCAGPGDGVVNADDALCDIWTSQQGQIGMLRFLPATCQFQSRNLVFDPLFGIQAAGAFTEALQNPGQGYDDDGYQITVPYVPVVEGGPGDVANQAVIVGSHDPSYAGMTLALPTSGCTPTVPFINVPYHTMYRKSEEVLCGLENVHWFDADMDGFPDTCPNGVFDERDVVGMVGGSLIQVITFDNVPDGMGRDNAFISQNVVFDPLFGYSWGGTTFNLIPGDAYRIALSAGHRDTLWLSPHF